MLVTSYVAAYIVVHLPVNLDLAHASRCICPLLASMVMRGTDAPKAPKKHAKVPADVCF